LQGLDSSRDEWKRQWYWALLVALIVACAYVGLVVTLDNTNLGTTNGLWKAPDVVAWEHGSHLPLDSGEFLYLDLYGHLVRLIPDSWLQYGVPAPDVTFRKMAMLNALFGGIASGMVFLLAWQFTNSRLAAASLVLLHAGAGFVLLNSINSEDILPAYSCFLTSAVCWFEFVQRGSDRLLKKSPQPPLPNGRGSVTAGKLVAAFLSRARQQPAKALFVLSALFLAFATLLHWTVMAPALVAFAAAFFFLALRNKMLLGTAAAWFFLFLVFLQALLLLALPRLHIPVWVALHPGKADAGGWVGLLAGKWRYFLIGAGNYFSGANNLSDYKTAFGNSSILHSMLVSWVYLAVTLTACLVTLLRRNSRRDEKVLAIFAITLFAVGEAGAIYSQPQDPQMQIEPMFATMAGAILLVGSGRLATLWRGGLVGLLAVVAVANGAWNIHLMRPGAGQDSAALAAVDEMERLFPRDRTIIVCHGFEGWTTWQYVVGWRGNAKAFHQSEVQLARPFTLNRGITGVAAADIVSKEIDAALGSGFRVVSAVLWTQSPDQMIGSLTTVTTEAEAKTYEAILRKEYRAGTHWNTRVGPFVEILPATQLSH